jgi:hypothetical protein
LAESTVAAESRKRFVERTPQEVIEQQKGEFHNLHYEIGSRANVAYLAWSDTAVAATNVEKCASK